MSSDKLFCISQVTNQHDLLASTGSESHGKPEQMPIKYRAEISRKLLERLGITLR